MAKQRRLYSFATFLFAFVAFNADRQGRDYRLASDLDEAAEEEAWLDVFERETLEEEEHSEDVEADDEQNSGDDKQNSADESHDERNSADGNHDEQNSAEGSHADGHAQKLQSSAPGHETVTKQEDEQLEQDHGERQTESDADASGHSLSAEFSCHDGEKTVNLPPIPRFIIVGAQKAGTSALYHLLGMVPAILPSKKFEPHFWDFKVPPGAARASPEERCRIRQRYARYWDEAESRKDGVVAFEKTPSLLALSKVPPSIKAVMAPYVPKIVVVLRNPVVRAYSQYKMNWQKYGRRATFPSFEEIVQEEVAEMRRRGFRIPQFNATTNDWTKSNKFEGAKQRSTSSIKKFLGYLLRGCYSRQLQFWMREFELGTQLKVAHYQSMERNKSAALQDLLSFVGAPPHNLTDETLDKDYGPTKFPTRTIEKTTDTSSQQRRRKRRRRTASGSNLKAPPPQGDEVQRYLENFYKPYNKELVNLLGDEWRGVWQ